MPNNDPAHLDPTNQPGHPSAGRDAADALNLGERAAQNLLRMATTEGQTVIDLDDDPTLRAATTQADLGYRAVDLTALDQPTEPGDLVALRWPRPGLEQSWLSSAPEVFAAVAALTAPGGVVAVILEPTPAHAFGITWTGVLLTAARAAELNLLQDIVCLHDLQVADDQTPDAAPTAALLHRIILILRTRTGRHAQA